MDSNDFSDFFSDLPDVKNWTLYGSQFATAAIYSLSDILDIPLNQIFQTAIMEHYRSCRLNYAACNQLIQLLKNKGINLLFDDNVVPDFSCVPKEFSAVATQNKKIVYAFDRLTMDLYRFPSVEELAFETYLSTDCLRSNHDLKQQSLERQQVANYVDWYCTTHECSFQNELSTSQFNYGTREINWENYPFNLFLDVVSAAKPIRKALEDQPELLARLTHRLDNLVYFDLSIWEQNVIASLYMEGAIRFDEPALKWGLKFWGLNKKCDVINKIRKQFQGERLLAEKGLLGTNAILKLSIEELNLSVRSFNCLSRAGVRTVEDILLLSEEGFMKIRNMGKKSIDEVMGKLKSLGIPMGNSDVGSN